MKIPSFLQPGDFFGENRSFSGILPHSRQILSSEVSIPGLPRGDILHDMLTLRPILGSTDIRKSVELGGGLFAGAGTQNRCISRRFPLGEPGSSTSAVSNQFGHRHSSVLGLDNQFQKVSVDPNPSSPVPGNNVEPVLGRKISSSRQEESHSRVPRESGYVRPLVLENRDENNRLSQFRGIRYSLRQDSLSPDSVGMPPSSEISTSQAILNTRGDSCSNSMVVTGSPQSFSYICSQSRGIHNNGCLRQWVGCANERPNVNGHLVCGSRDLAHKCQGVVCCAQGSRIKSFVPQRQVYPGSIRQSNSSCLHPKGGGYPISAPAERNRVSVPSSRKQQYISDSQLYSRNIQQYSGQSFASESTTRLAPIGSNVEMDIPAVGDACNRLIRDQEFSGRPNVCVSVSSRPSGLLHRRVLQKLDLSSGMGVSSSSSATPSPSTSPQVTGKVHHNSSELGEGVLASGSEAEGIGSSSSLREPQKSPNRLSLGSASSRSELPEFAGLVGSGWVAQTVGWEKNDLQLLQSAWRKSTLSSYKAPWQRWSSWSSKAKVSLNNPSPQDLARFLSYLHSENFAYSTILVHKSVVTTIANPARASELSGHPIVRQVLKAISIKSVSESREIWDISTLIAWIKSHPPSENNHFLVSRHLALILLLASGRRVHDLTLLRTSAKHFQDNGDHVVFWPAFGSKTDKVSHRQSGWRLNENQSDSTLDPVKWVRKLNALSSIRAGSKSSDSLFITTRGRVKPASRSVIAGWVRTAMLESGYKGFSRICKISARVFSNGSRCFLRFCLKKRELEE
uniref:Core-binding (CB) domain-containing protein n=1 Tax=Cacopsylla melanoneura TaxID=428564 RepID=A0A8D8QTA7_9HEMI